MSQLGRIGGQVLTDNLLRAGVDLAFETDLLYLDVTNNRIGVRDSTPIYDLDVNSNIRTNELTVVTQLAPGNLRINSPETITTSVGGIDVYINGGGEIFHDRVITNNLVFDGNQISSISNSNIVLDPNGSGTVEFRAATDITGDLAVTGNITMSGNLTSLGTVIIGDSPIDTVTISPDFTQSIIPGDDVTYAMGADAGDSSPRRWAELHSPAWQNISTGAWPGSGLVTSLVTVSGQTALDGNINKISAAQSNDDVVLLPDTGILRIESLQFGEDPAFGLTQTLNNPNPVGTSTDDQFGQSMAISGSRLIVSAPNEDDAGSGSGKAYIYDLDTNSLLYTLANPNAFGTSNFDFFGSSVGISSSYAIVGAVGEMKIDENDASYYLTGKAYIFNATTGALLHTLDNPSPGTTEEDQFGGNVAITNTRAIVSSVGYPNISYSGRAYIYNTVTGALLYTLSNPNVFGTTTNDNFGSSVAISDSYAIVGAPGEDDTVGFPGSGSGKAYIYNASTGAFLRTLSNPNADGFAFQDGFGSSVAISDSYAVVGVPDEDDASFSSGKVYIFNPATGALLRTLSNPNVFGTATNDNFGSSVAISGSTVIVGAPNEDDAGGTSSGKAYIFDISTGTLLHTLNNPNAYGTSANDSFGRSVAISDLYTVAGAYQEDDASGLNSGKAYIFSISSDQSAIKNLLNTPLTLATTGTGYYLFAGTNGMVVPVGNNSQRRASPEVGETRWNTEEGYLECYDGTVWAVSTGGGIDVTVEIMEDLGHVYTLMLG